MAPTSRTVEWGLVERALRSADLVSGGGADCEVLVRASRGAAFRRSRSSPAESASWRERGFALRLVLDDGRSGLATRADWEGAQDAAREALALAESSAPGSGVTFPRSRECAVVDAGVAMEPPSPSELEAALARVEAAALESDERIVALDTTAVRAAVVESCLATSAGTALHQRHASVLLHAAVLARDGLRVAGYGAAWAGSVLDERELDAFGHRLGRAAAVHLVGSGAAPPTLRRVLIAPQALADVTFALAPALLGLARGGALAESLVAPEALSLVEDAVDDRGARVLAADGAARPLQRVDVVAAGRWSAPRRELLPLVRSGLSDLPRRGWLRLTWGWSGGASEDALVERLGTGLLVESAHVLEVDAPSLGWRGAVSGTWVEDGRRRHAVAGHPLEVTFAQILGGAVAGGSHAVSAHASGTIRSMALLVDLERAKTPSAP